MFLISPLWLALTFCGAGRAQSPAVRPAAAQARVSGLDSAEPRIPDKIYAQLWIELSPEYRALCLQTFNLALAEVERQVSQAPRLEGKPVGASGKRLAVVTDLDETILDNSGYQTELILQGTDYTPASWKAWVERVNGVRLIPGAADFIRRVEELGVTMVYLSNRLDSEREFTLRTLEKLGLDTSELRDGDSPRLLLRQAESDKEPRRARVARSYEIIALLGDDLGDFPGPLSEDYGRRYGKVEAARELWGSRWFVFPNPVYGSWTDAQRGRDPLELLRELLEREGGN